MCLHFLKMKNTFQSTDQSIELFTTLCNCVTSVMHVTIWYIFASSAKRFLKAWITDGRLFMKIRFCNHLVGMRELIALLSLSSRCLVIVVCLFLTVPWVSLQFVIVVFPDHTHYFWPQNTTTPWLLLSCCHPLILFVYNL